jgi:hypothetical protein
VNLTEPATEPVELPATEVFQASFELAGVRGAEILPAGLAPTIPTLITFLVVRVTDGPLGAFTYAQARLSCRSGVRARALAVAGAAEGAAADALARRWGIGGDQGPVVLDRRYDRVAATVPAWGLHVELTDPVPIGATDVQYVVGLHPVDTGAGPRLAQVELDVHPGRAERGRAHLVSYDGLPVAGRADPIRPAHPVAATLVVGSLTLPRVRFLLRPEAGPQEGTEVLSRSA